MKRKPTIVGAIILFLIIGGIGLSRASAPAAPKPTPTSESAQAVTITAKGSIVPVKQAKLTFKPSGIIEAVLVKAGDKVTKGQELARLETADLQLQVRAAEDALAVNEALLEQAKAGVRPEEIEAAEASYAGALAKYNQTARGATEADIKAAEQAVTDAQAAVAKAQADLTKLKSGPTQDDITVAKAEVDKAQATLQQAQTAYDKVSWRGDIMSLPEAAALQQATTTYQAALANYKLKTAPAKPEDITSAEKAVDSAQAALVSAQAKLDLLKAGPTNADLQAAKSSVASAKASLDAKTKGASQAEIEVALAKVQQAKTGVEQAKLALANAILQAPFDGTVVNVALREGEIVSPTTTAIILGDLQKFQVETSDLDEAGAAKIQIGQPVSVTVNAFDDKILSGKVVSIAPVATLTQSGDANYVATIDLDGYDEAVRWGMTTKVDFGVPK